MNNKPTVFIVDDDLDVLESLKETVLILPVEVECFHSGLDFLESYEIDRRGCLVLDIRMPIMTGVEIQLKLKELGSHLPVIFITGHGDVAMSVKAMQNGALDFLEKPYRPAALRKSIKRALEINEKYWEKQEKRNDHAEKIASLTDSEREVMELMIAGKSNKVISSALDISLRTVQFRRVSILKKLEVDSRAALVAKVLTMEMQNEAMAVN